MDFLIANWYLLVAGLALLVLVGVVVYNFIKNPSSKQLEKVKKWMLQAVIFAEAELGTGTGKLKLSFVFDVFVQRFPWLAKVVSFELFSSLVDTTLEEMREMLKTNKNVRRIIQIEKTISATSIAKDLEEAEEK